MFDLERKTLNYIREYEMVSPGERVFIALSGGADSVCLLLCLRELSSALGITVGAVHIEHGIRGQASLDDAEFVRELCERLGVPLVSRSFDVPRIAGEGGTGLEEAARGVRYETFASLLSGGQCDKVAIAHHCGDMVETVLFNLARGSSLAGLSGIKPVRGRYIRPLLWAQKSEIEEYLAARGQDFVTDESNADETYSRNRLRHTVVPELEKVHAGAAGNIARAAMLLGEADSYFKREAARFCAEYVTGSEEELSVEIDELCKPDAPLPSYVIYDCIVRVRGGAKDITQAHVDAVGGILHSGTGASVDLPGGLTAAVSYGRLTFGKRESGNDNYSREEACVDVGELPFECEFGGYKVTFSAETVASWEEIRRDNRCTKYIDCGKIMDGMQLRYPRRDDYLVIDDAGHTKRLNRLFIDSKVPAEKRERFPVLCDGSRVIWALGLRFSKSHCVSDLGESIVRIDITEIDDEGRN
ncbi:MAG: tRNA lysidine(34) synthetase TilS [Eubacterium sp.]|nr:tRNA lysidine(34) synthetase TilS [Eubacterium sp.]